MQCEQEMVSPLKRYRTVGNHLIILPETPQSPHADRVIDRFGGATLDRPSEINELDRFQSIIVVNEAKPVKEDDLRVQSIYTNSPDFPLSTLGIISPSVRKVLDNFQTLTGLLYPSEVKLADNSLPNLTNILRALDKKRVWCLTHLLSPRKQAKAIEEIIAPEDQTHRLGIFGIGDIGTFVASVLRQSDRAETKISDLFIGGSRSREKIEAQLLELRHINIEGVHQPNVFPVYLGEEETFFKECDMILVLIAGEIPQADEKGIDVRSAQYMKNLGIITNFLERATIREYDGQILMGSDPVEQLTMAMYKLMKDTGWDVNTHQFAGFGTMINRSRAKAVADEFRLDDFSRSGRVFGPHGKMVVVIPTHDPELYNSRQAEQMSILTGHGNYEIRKQHTKPYVGPSVLIARGIRDMFDQGVLYASPFIPGNKGNDKGAFFGTRVNYFPNPGVWVPRVEQPYLSQVIPVLERAHKWTSVTSQNPEALEHDPFEDEKEHPAFHPYMLEQWLDLVMEKSK